MDDGLVVLEARKSLTCAVARGIKASPHTPFLSDSDVLSEGLWHPSRHRRRQLTAEMSRALVSDRSWLAQPRSLTIPLGLFCWVKIFVPQCQNAKAAVPARRETHGSTLSSPQAPLINPLARSALSGHFVLQLFQRACRHQVSAAGQPGEQMLKRAFSSGARGRRMTPIL